MTVYTVVAAIGTGILALLMAIVAYHYFSNGDTVMGSVAMGAAMLNSVAAGMNVQALIINR